MKLRKLLFYILGFCLAITFGVGCNNDDENYCFHGYVSTKDTATCTEAGEIQHVCKHCGDTYVEITEPKGHSFALLSDTAECLSVGKKTWECTECAYAYTENSPATGHIYDYTGFCKFCKKYEYDIQLGVSLPLYLQYQYTGTGHIYSKCVITEVTFSGSYTPRICFSGWKTYDDVGIYGTGQVAFTWILKDSNGNIVSSGTPSISGLVVNQKFNEERKIGVTLSREERYVLEIVSHLI